jgi:hypothetical protein
METLYRQHRLSSNSLMEREIWIWVCSWLKTKILRPWVFLHREKKIKSNRKSVQWLHKHQNRLKFQYGSSKNCLFQINYLYQLLFTTLLFLNNISLLKKQVFSLSKKIGWLTLNMEKPSLPLMESIVTIRRDAFQGNKNKNLKQFSITISTWQWVQKSVLIAFPLKEGKDINILDLLTSCVTLL